MIKAVIFDIGNVLVKVNLELWIDAFKKIGIAKADQLFQGPEMRQVIEGSYGIGKMSTQELMDYVFHKGECENVSVNAFRDAWNSVIIRVYEDALRTVTALREQGLQVYTLSDTNEMHIAYIEALYLKIQKTHSAGKFVDLFDKCYLSHLTGHRKAQKEAWLDIVQEQHLLPEECLFVDDLKLNTDRAKALGFLVFQYQPSHTMAEVVAEIQNINSKKKKTLTY